MKRYVNLLFFVFLSVLLISWMGCGSSRSTVDQSSSEQPSQEDDFDEIEKLLGISREDDAASKQSQAKPAKQEKKDDDLITLLEADEGKSSQPAASTQSTGDQRVVRLQNEIEDLEKQLKKKDMEIADLRTQIKMKEEEARSRPAAQPTDYSYTAPAAAATSRSGGTSSDDYVNRYNNALSMFHGREYQDAITAFEQLLSTDINHSYSDNAQYWIGECYYAMGRYREAVMAFEKVFTFPQSNKNDYAQFKIGQCYYKLDENARARQEFQQLIDSYPESELVPRARRYLAES